MYLSDGDMKRFRNCIIDRKIRVAIDETERLLLPDSPLMALASVTKFKYGAENVDVVRELTKERELINIYTYRPWNPFSKAIGYFDGKAIHINIKMLESFDYKKVVGLLIHEYSHYCGFTHGNNFVTEGKKKFSVPYWLSENVIRF
jgi:hypothetical protein